MDEAKPKRDLDEPVKIALDPETAIKALMQVDPEDEPVDPQLPVEEDEDSS